MKTGRTDNWTAVHPNQNLEPLAANQPFASKDPARVSDIGLTLFRKRPRKPCSARPALIAS